MDTDEGSGAERFFYHSFPRPRRGETREVHVQRAERILESMARIGLLLTPERTQWQERLANGGLGRLVDLWQKRMSLTELSPQELREHSAHFGPFALEFGLEEFLQMGGLPVFYLPALPDVPRGNEGLGAALMTRLAEVNAILERIEALANFGKQSAAKNAPFFIKIPGGPTLSFRTTVGGLEDVLAYLTVDGQSARSLRGSLNAFAGLFSPTENLRYTGRLGYYRQREWRLLAGFAIRDVQIARAVTEAEAKELERLDPDFFSQPIDDPARSDRTRGQECRVISMVNDRPALEWARRILVPSDSVASAKHIVGGLATPPRVVAIESL